MKSIICIVIFLFPMTNLIQAQDEEPDTLRNSVYFSLGGEGSFVSCSYELQFWQTKQMNLRLKTAMGLYISSWTYDVFGGGGDEVGFSTDFPVGIEFLAGHNNKFDGGAGVTFGLGPDIKSDAQDKTSIWYWSEVGYRHISISEKFMLRLDFCLSMHPAYIDNYDKPDENKLLFTPGITLGLGGNF